MDRIYIFRHHDIERGTGKPGYSWCAGYNTVTLDGVCYPGQTLKEWRKEAASRGAKLVVCDNEEIARDKLDRHLKAVREHAAQ